MDIPFEVVPNPPARVARSTKYAALKTALIAAGERGEWIAIHRARFADEVVLDTDSGNATNAWLQTYHAPRK